MGKSEYRLLFLHTISGVLQNHFNCRPWVGDAFCRSRPRHGQPCHEGTAAPRCPRLPWGALPRVKVEEWKPGEPLSPAWSFMPRTDIFDFSGGFPTQTPFAKVPIYDRYSNILEGADNGKLVCVG